MANKLLEKAKLVRKLSLISTTQAGSGHPTSSLSATDLGTVLFESFFTYDFKDPHNPNNDRFVLSKGHASPLYYALFAVAGAISFDELSTLRKFGSRIEGHPTMEFPYTDAATGSLGQGLSVGAGMALVAKREERKNHIYVLLGDGEVAEGQIWEAANFASFYKLDNLVAIVDVNALGQSQHTMFDHDTKKHADRFRAFGFETVVVDGHNMTEIATAFTKATTNKNGKPFAIVAKTLKGKGVSFIEGKDGWHGKALKKEDLDKALLELGEIDEKVRFKFRLPADYTKTKPKAPLEIAVPYKKGEEIATREVYGQVLAALANKDKTIYALDADVKNSTFSQDFLKAHPERFVECFIAEQNMVSSAVGLSRLGKRPFVSTFAAFLTRSADQIRMAGISKANIKFVGSHAGVSIGEDGSSQMGLEDIALFGTIPHSVIIHPSDASSTAELLPELLVHEGISYLRTLRPKTAVLYSSKETFRIGGSKVLHKSKNDYLTVVASGITVHEALKAYNTLFKAGITIRVIDCYSIKPIDRRTLIQAILETSQKTILTVEDHYVHGGLGDFVLDALSDQEVRVEKLAVKEFSRSGKSEELLEDAGIDATNIVAKIKELYKKK